MSQLIVCLLQKRPTVFIRHNSLMSAVSIPAIESVFQNEIPGRFFHYFRPNVAFECGRKVEGRQEGFDELEPFVFRSSVVGER